MSDELKYIKQSFAEMHGLKMSVTYLGNDAVGASNASLIMASFSVFFLKLVNTSGISLMENGKSSA